MWQLLKRSRGGIGGFVCIVVWLFFVVGSGLAITGSYNDFLFKLTSANNYSYVATVVVGLVLAAAGGVVGASAPSVPAPNPAGGAPPPAVMGMSKDQKDAVRQLYAWSYIVIGILCILSWIAPSPHQLELVKQLALTCVGLFAAIVSGLN